ncbi:hypothetical protein E2C01_000698 [Portunus trituberculatus]|uniref:Uncharacterized protein n=1 Tax=Portunus trituberculatus TaxID=210409 RepID=A0A5B7CKF2_PORTR|nr:hypothetical protein [Portunus trituberculatus]
MDPSAHLGVNAIGIVDFSIHFLNADAGGSCTVQVPHGVQTHITKALETWSDANHRHVGGFVDKVLKAVENATSSCRGAAVDATLVDGLASDTGMGIDVIVSAIHDISRSPVPMSGAGTSTPGPVGFIRHSLLSWHQPSCCSSDSYNLNFPALKTRARNAWIATETNKSSKTSPLLHGWCVGGGLSVLAWHVLGGLSPHSQHFPSNISRMRFKWMRRRTTDEDEEEKEEKEEEEEVFAAKASIR